ncbi:MAG: DUF3488 domain-containing protein [Puniceicoccaceae bacterium]|nr:MAG: DUF3488 domain-containing protein [Puniceicoccaceae bacterium]
MSTGHRQVRLSTEELQQVKQLMGALMALLSFWSLFALDIGSELVILTGVLAALAALFLPRWVARIPAMTWKWAGPVILMVIVVDFMLHLPEFIAPLVRMVVLLIIYRVMAPRNHREDLQVILLCLFCLVVSGVMTVSLLFAVQILLFTPLAMALLFVICLLDRGGDSVAHVTQWSQFSWARLARRVWRVFDFKVVVLSGILFAAVVTVSTLLFILTPRFDLDRAIPFLQMSTKSLSGFNDEVRLGEVSEIQEDNRVALRIDLPSIDALTEEPYWRMLVLDEYGQGRFRASESLRQRPLRRFANEREIRPEGGRQTSLRGEVWTVYMEGGVSRYLPLPGEYSAVRFEKFQNLERVDAVHVLGLDSVGQSVFSYRVEDLSFNRRFASGEADEAVLAVLGDRVVEPRSTEYPMTTLALDLSETESEFLAAINRGIVDQGPADAAVYAQAATDYLWQRFNYSLSPDGRVSGGADPILHWLKNGTQGHCELFAGAFVLMARAAGYPARMVVGFAGGSWNPVEDYFIVRNRHAHAWVEIYDPVEGNWLRVDPTPGRSSSDPEVAFSSQMQFESGWFSWVDSLRIQWYRRIVNFEQEDQVDLALGLKAFLQEHLNGLKERIQAIGRALRSVFSNPFEQKHLPWFVVLVFSLIGAYTVWLVRHTFFQILFKLLRRPKALDPVRRQSAHLLKRCRAKQAEPGIVAELQELRFGPARSLRSAAPIFKRARGILRKM